MKNGWTMAIPQFWFGHRADKATLLYICGLEPRDIPEIPFKLGEATHVIQSRKREGCRPHVSKAEREQTPIAFAEWLVELARRTTVELLKEAQLLGTLRHRVAPVPVFNL